MRALTSILAFFNDATPAAQSRLLPARIQRLIEAQEDESEQLIGWVQLAVVMSLAILFLIAPRPADAPSRSFIEPVPLALFAYFLFTLARLHLAYKGRLPGSLLLASILADVGLLLALIWAFHGQYGQSAPFSLKVPTFVYLFVFISLRALRFDHRYVLAAGLAAAAGWVLLLIAVVAKSGTGEITRSFVAHLSSNRILLGAEFDKILSVLLVTAVLSFAVRRGRGLFVTAIRDEAALKDLSRFFGKGVSDTVLEAEIETVAGMAEERDAAVLMLDIRGFTGLSHRLTPRRVVELLTRLHGRVIPIVRANGGVIDKFLGDGIMATFGAVKPSQTPAADALRALEAVMTAAAAWQREVAGEVGGATLEVHGAAVAGPVVFAIVGAGDRLEYTVIGEAVNLSAKLEKHNKVERTRALTTVETFELAKAQGFTPSGEIETRARRSVAGAEGETDLVVLRA